jgi:hypothetical protein
MTTEYKIKIFKIGECPVLDYIIIDNETPKKEIIERDYHLLIDGLTKILEKSELNELHAKIELG